MCILLHVCSYAISIVVAIFCIPIAVAQSISSAWRLGALLCRLSHYIQGEYWRNIYRVNSFAQCTCHTSQLGDSFDKTWSSNVHQRKRTCKTKSPIPWGFIPFFFALLLRFKKNLTRFCVTAFRTVSAKTLFSYLSEQRRWRLRCIKMALFT